MWPIKPRFMIPTEMRYQLEQPNWRRTIAQAQSLKDVPFWSFFYEAELAGAFGNDVDSEE